MIKERGKRKTRTGKVVSKSGDKSVVVKVERRVPHPLYGKVVKKFKKYHAHDESNEINVGDTVSIIESKPISRLKRWRIAKVINKAGQ